MVIIGVMPERCCCGTKGGLRLGANLEHTSLPGNFLIRRYEILMKYSEEEEIIDQAWEVALIKLCMQCCMQSFVDRGLQNLSNRFEVMFCETMILD